MAFFTADSSPGEFSVRVINGKKYSLCLTCFKYSQRKDSSWGTTGRLIINQNKIKSAQRTHLNSVEHADSIAASCGKNIIDPSHNCFIPEAKFTENTMLATQLITSNHLGCRFMEDLAQFTTLGTQNLGLNRPNLLGNIGHSYETHRK